MPKAPTKPDPKNRISVIRFIYLYLITAITFIVFIIGAVNIVDMGLKVFVFDVDEDYYERPVVMCDRFMYSPEGEKNDNEGYQDCLKRQKELDEERKSRFISESSARRLSIGIAQVVVALPLWIFHWRIIERDRKERKKRGRASHAKA